MALVIVGQVLGKHIVLGSGGVGMNPNWALFQEYAVFNFVTGVSREHRNTWYEP